MSNRDTNIRKAIELFFFAYRDFTGEADTILDEYGFGRAHHRAIYFIGRSPRIAVHELLAILKITKQSLGRVLGQLITEGYVRQEIDEKDGRRRLLTLTKFGASLERLLTERQSQRIEKAYALSGKGADRSFLKVLEHMIDDLGSIHPEIRD
ncbi:MAG: MarR family transcriptional regulator [Magnetovibrio sp.]|nr:MarR family transcriptional regulator [Magnetovibrio sp.]|tara:strand:+ start:919 stop:1374 length:456 start_codon:yes stop_codon:yes gene_type:complete